MKNKKWLIGLGFTILFVLLAFSLRPQDETTRIKQLIRKETDTDQSIMLYNDISQKEHTLVSYVLHKGNVYQGVKYAHLLMNEKGQYELLDIIEPDRVTKAAQDIHIYEFNQLSAQFLEKSSDGNSIDKREFILSNHPDLSKIERIIDDKEETEIKEIQTNPSVSFFDPIDTINGMTYKFYDQQGGLLN